MNMTKGLAILSLAIGLGLFLQPAYAQATGKKYVAGRIVNVSQEKVTVNTAVLDKITVSVESCDARGGALKSVFYAPATVSDRTALGHLFDQDIQSARTPNMETQHQPNGFGIFWVDDTGRVLRTGILGANVDCNLVPALVNQFP